MELGFSYGIYTSVNS